MARLKKKAKRRISLVFILIVLLFGVYFIQNRNNNPIDKIINIVLPENPIKTPSEIAHMITIDIICAL